MIDGNFWKGKTVFVTGHTGFKGAWLSLWLYNMGAKVSGYALTPPTDPSLFELADINAITKTTIGDIRDGETLKRALAESDAEIVFHMAAQPLVRRSYEDPVETYSTNVMGTLNVFEAVRAANSAGKNIKTVVNITTDKTYENHEWHWGYRENDRLGGYDPYSNSKACSELVTSSYRNSFFHPDKYVEHGVTIASARAGNVIGGGDWAVDRLIPDAIRALIKNEIIEIRNPHSIRPWQHVLEPLGGYLVLAEKLHKGGANYVRPDGNGKMPWAWNFGPDDTDARPVSSIVGTFCELWGKPDAFQVIGGDHPHEANYLKLDCSLARAELDWAPIWKIEKTLDSIVHWTRAYQTKPDSLRTVCLEQIEAYQADMNR